MVTGSGPADELDDEGLLAAYPWPDSGRWVRAMMATTLDGSAAGPDGLSGSISSETDRRVFDSVRRLADTVLVGAGTLRAEGYGPMRAKPADAGRRAAAGQGPAPVLAVVSGSLDLPWGGEVFAQSSLRPIVITGSGVDADLLETARADADVVVTGSDKPTPDEIVEALESRGLRRIVCEGGPTLLEGLVGAGLVDEADITLSPMFVGTGQSPRTDGQGGPARLRLVQVIEGEGYLMNRYLRGDS